MNLIDLTEEMKTGIPAMDMEHQFLVDSLNNVHDLLHGDKQAAYDYFQEVIVAYVDKHLRHEESLMLKYGYPDVEMHIKSHGIYKKVVMDLIPAIQSGNPKAFMEVYAISMGWLVGHIQKVDKKYAIWFSEKGLLDELGNEQADIKN